MTVIEQGQNIMIEKNPYNDRHLVAGKNVLPNLFTLGSPASHVKCKFILLGRKLS